MHDGTHDAKGKSDSRERRDLQFLAPRFYEFVVIGIAATFPAIHVEPDRFEPLR